MHVGVGVRGLVRHQQLDGRAEDRVGKLTRSGERLELVAEVAAEQVVDDGQHLRARAVVHRQGQHSGCGVCAPLAKHLYVRVAEAVDRLELVPDEELLALGAGDQVDQLALQPVGVLELVHHDSPETELLAFADRRVVAEQVARTQLQVLEVECGLAVLRLLIGRGECREQLLQQITVAGGELIQRRLLEGAPSILVRCGALAAAAKLAQIEQPFGALALERDVLAETARSFVELVQALLQAAALAELEHELAPGRAEGLVHAGEHAA